MSRTSASSSTAWRALTLGTLLVSACAADTTPPETSTETDGTSDTPRAEPGVIEGAATGTTRTVEIGRFHGRYEAATGRFTLENVEIDRPEATADGLRAIGQAAVDRDGFCAVPVALQDGIPNNAATGSVEVYSIDGTTGFDPSICADLADDGFTAYPPDVTDFFTSGVFCTSVIVRSFIDAPLNEVYAEIYEFTGATTQYGYRFPLGTGAQVPDVWSAPDNTYGLWYYGDLGPADRVVGSTQNPPDERVQQWSFRFSTTDDFEFTGRIVAMVAESCGDTMDNNCDGRPDENCNLYPVGAACVTGADCTTWNCASGVCAPSTCASGALDGLETDVDCGGGCAPCATGLDCNVGSDCDSEYCRANTCRANPNPLPGEAVITEVLVNGAETGTENSEWFEVHNPTTHAIDLEGCELRDNGGDVHVVTGELVIAAGDYAVLARSADPALNFGLPFDYVYGGSINMTNGPDNLTILCNGNSIDGITWSSTGNLLSVQGRSLSVSSDARNVVANDVVTNVCWGMTTYDTSGTFDSYGTPGAANPSCNTTIAGCTLNAPSGAVGALLGGTIATTGIAETTNPATTAVSGSADRWHRFVAQSGSGPAADAPSSASWTWSTSIFPTTGTGAADGFAINASLPVSAGSGYAIGMRVSGDGGTTWTYCDNATTAAYASADGFAAATAPALTMFPAATAPNAAGQVLITEVLANEVDGGSADEWIELYNPGIAPLELNGCSITDAASTSFTINTPVLLMPGAYAVLANTSSSSTNGGLPSVAFDYSTVLMNNGAESLTFRCGATPIDTVAWTVSALEGYSMQLHPSYFTGSGNDSLEATWCQTPAANTYGSTGTHWGTPGSANVSNCIQYSDCYVQSPASATRDIGSSLQVNAFFRAANLTDRSAGGGTSSSTALSNMASGLVDGELGYGPVGADPSANPELFTWANAAYDATFTSTGIGNYDGLTGSFNAPGPAGSYRYAYRLSTDGGLTHTTYCDTVGLPFAAAESGVLTTTVPTVTQCVVIPGPADAAAGEAYVLGAIIDRPGTTDVDPPTALANVRAGFGPRGSQPITGTALSGSWTWSSQTAIHPILSENDPSDLYLGAFSVPSGATVPDRDATMAFSLDGSNWFACDQTLRDVSTAYAPAQAGQFTIGAALVDTIVNGTMPTTALTGTPQDYDVAITVVGPDLGDMTALTADASDTLPDVVVQFGRCDQAAVGGCGTITGANWTWTGASNVGGLGDADIWRAGVTFASATTYDTAWRIDVDPAGTVWEYSTDVPYSQPVVPVTVGVSGATPCFLFSRYMEGDTGNDKMVQVWNCGGTVAPARLTVGSFTDGTAISSYGVDGAQTNNRVAVGTFLGGYYTFCNSGVNAALTSVCSINASTITGFNGNDALILWDDVDNDGKVDSTETVWDRIGDTDGGVGNNFAADVLLTRRNTCSGAGANPWAAYTAAVHTAYFFDSAAANGSPPSSFTTGGWTASLAALTCTPPSNATDMVHVLMPTTATSLTNTTFTVDVTVPGITDITAAAADPNAGLVVEIGRCDDTALDCSDPTSANYTAWTAATAISGAAGVDRYGATIQFPSDAAAKTYAIAWRATTNPVSPVVQFSTTTFGETAGSVSVAATAGGAACFRISRYLEGDASNKAVQVWNCGTTAAPANLTLGLAFNAATNVTSGAAYNRVITTLGAGQFADFCNGATASTFTSTVTCEYSVTGTSALMAFNGDDRLLLWEDSDVDGIWDSGEVVHDRFGELDVQPASTTWENDYYRRSTCTNASGTDPTATTFTVGSFYTAVDTSVIAGDIATIAANWNSALGITCP